MRKEMKINISNLMDGMILSRDVELDNCLVLAKDTKLSTRLIHYLNTRDLGEVWVYEEPTDQVYEKTFQENMESFRNIATLVQNGEEIKQDDVKDIIKNYLDIPSKQALFKYTNGIRQADQYTYEHSLSVCYLAILLAKWIHYPYLNELAQAALLHDLGKIKIANEILNKPGALTDEEWKQMKLHPVYGYEFLRSNSDFPEEIAKGVLYHHEKTNGSGYPSGLKGHMIPEMARIIAICDVFDALTSNRVYRKKMDMFEVMQYMYNQYQFFDAEYLRTFIENMMDYLIGENVLLSNGKVGKIIFKSSTNPFELLIQTGTDFFALNKSNIKVAQVL